MEKLKMQTANKADENFRKLAAMFPDAVTETINENGEVVRAIDKDVLMQEISCTVVDGNEERYQFTWPDKKKSVLLANAPINKTLRPCREESVDFDTTENLYIEGDNLEVLKLLQETYLGKIKMIYIDPPYNTGNDFVYEDDFAQSTDEYLANSGQFDEDGNRMVQNTESNGRFHTDWLNMIYPRLRIAKNLLAGNGVIFISIDDNEIENMKKLCDEVYGATSFVAQLVWEKKKKGSFLSKSITNVKEYILVYCKNIDGFEGLIGEINDEEETYPCINAVNKRELRTIPAGIESKYRDKDFFMPKGSEISDTTIYYNILQYCLLQKDKAFAYEQEYRIALPFESEYLDDSCSREFIISETLIKPQIEFKNFPISEILEEVIISPFVKSELTHMGVQELLKANGISPDIVLKSNILIR